MEDGARLRGACQRLRLNECVGLGHGLAGDAGHDTGVQDLCARVCLCSVAFLPATLVWVLCLCATLQASVCKMLGSKLCAGAKRVRQDCMRPEGTAWANGHVMHVAGAVMAGRYSTSKRARDACCGGSDGWKVQHEQTGTRCMLRRQ